MQCVEREKVWEGTRREVERRKHFFTSSIRYSSSVASHPQNGQVIGCESFDSIVVGSVVILSPCLALCFTLRLIDCLCRCRLCCWPQTASWNDETRQIRQMRFRPRQVLCQLSRQIRAFFHRKISPETWPPTSLNDSSVMDTLTKDFGLLR